jgi:hypothetical protein
MRTKHTLLAALVLVLFSFTTHAQSLVLCESYNLQGEPTGIYSNWDIPATGANVYILYRQSGPLTTTGVWFLYIDIMDDATGKYRPIETIAMTPNGNSWYVVDQKFSEVGKFKASIMYNGTEMASTFFDIAYEPGAAASVVAGSGGTTIDTYYYEDSYILIGTGLDDTKSITGEGTDFALAGQTSLTLYMYLTNYPKPLETNLIYVDIYRGEDAAEYDSFSITIEKDWDFCYFNTSFTEPGLYYVDMYTADDIFINTAEFIIEK